MTTITTPILPVTPTFAKVKGKKELHKEAICIFAATGFFLDMDTYWTNEVVLPAGHICTIDAGGFLIDYKPWFTWHHTPRAISFETALEEFTSLFEQIVKEQTEDKQVILPLSGGLDSRSQAIALKHIGAKVNAYSYEYSQGYAETKIAADIAEVCGFQFEKFTIPKGYLWNELDDLATLNGCYSDFTSPRQMGVYKQLQDKGEVFSLGHWGDVLFDDVGVTANVSTTEQAAVILKKIIKKGGLDLAVSLWEDWELPGTFYNYLLERVVKLLQHINIPEDANAQIRAFKSLYWAPRWTSVNLSVFKAIKPISLPYYDDRMCAFICSLPEAYLANRQLQIAYIKARAPKVAAVTWQDHRPFNLYNYTQNKVPYNLPYRIIQKLMRSFQKSIGRHYVQRNWELQFLGEANPIHLRNALNNQGDYTVISKTLVAHYHDHFVSNPTPQTAHAVNMLLVILKRLEISKIE